MRNINSENFNATQCYRVIHFRLQHLSAHFYVVKDPLRYIISVQNISVPWWLSKYCYGMLRAGLNFYFIGTLKYICHLSPNIEQWQILQYRAFLLMLSWVKILLRFCDSNSDIWQHIYFDKQVVQQLTFQLQNVVWNLRLKNTFTCTLVPNNSFSCAV